MNSGESKNYWDVLAGQFQHQQPPLRPCREDIGLYQQAIQDCASRLSSSQLNALLFGVTPEIVSLKWPVNSHLLAVEKSQPMIDRFWPGDISGQRRVVHENWFNLELAENSLDIVIGDGVLTSLSYPDQYRQIARLISRWLKPEGRLILRVFARSPKTETLEDILADLRDGRISKFDILKWRLAMMLQKNIHEGVLLDDVYRAWATIENEHPHLLPRTGWPPATMNTIKLYDGRRERYTFPTLNEVDEAFSLHWRRGSTVELGYDFGECCPIVSYCRTGLT